MSLDHPELVDLLQRAYSAEKAAAFAYIGHAASVSDQEAKLAIREIELDEWKHRIEVLKIMDDFGIPISDKYERTFHILGRTISASCYVIGRFMPFYFAGRLESGNVCEYFRMMHFFHELDIDKYDEVLYKMGIKEKEHEVYFLRRIEKDKLLPLFEWLFSWGNSSGFNDVDLDKKYPVQESEKYCRKD